MPVQYKTPLVSTGQGDYRRNWMPQGKAPLWRCVNYKRLFTEAIIPIALIGGVAAVLYYGWGTL